MALFNEHYFWDYMRESPKIKERNIIRRYEALFGTLKDMDIRQTRFYKNYLSKFDFPFRVNTPEVLEDECDWDLLQRLIAGSYSSKMRLEINQEWLMNPSGEILVDIYMKVKSGGEEIEKKLDELWGFQIIRLYEIYIEEQMDMLVAVYLMQSGITVKENIEEVSECDVSNLQPVTHENDNVGSLGFERMIRIRNLQQQIESIRAKIEKNRVDSNSEKENEVLELLLDELLE